MKSIQYQSVFDSTSIPSVYNAARNLSPETLKMWMNTISSRIEPNGNIKTIIDLGCGTGRFTSALAEHFNCKVIGIDPSGKMLAVAAKPISSGNIEFINGSADSMPVPDISIDMVFLSQVYHHITDSKNFVLECKRVLRNNGFICIRNSNIDNMDSYIYPKFFPSALEIDMNRLPHRKNILELFSQNNFIAVFAEEVKQVFAENLKDYYEKVSLRGCSDLAVISDAEFNEGLIKLKHYCEQNNSNESVFEEIDLLIFQKV